MAWLGKDRRVQAWQAISNFNNEVRMKISTISWKQNVPTKGIEAEKAFNALESIRKQNNGLTDDAVVQAAKPQNHTLHKWFEWDDSVAAVEYRRDQARNLLRSLEVTYEERPEIKTRVYEVEHKSRPRDEERTVYTTTEEILQNPEARDRLIAEAIRQAMAFRRRFKAIHELDAVMSEIDRAVEKLGTEVVS